MKRKKLFISLTAVCAVLVFLGIFVLMSTTERFRRE